MPSSKSSSRPLFYPKILSRFVFALLLTLPAAASSGTPWEKSPEQWSEADTYKILRDSPWSPAKVKFESVYTQRHVDTQTGIVSSSPVNVPNTGAVPGIEMSKSKRLPDVPVLWESAKTVRLAQQRLQQLKAIRADSAAKLEPLRAEAMPDYILLIAGSEYFRILKDAKEDLHDTVFLEMPDGFSIDLATVNFFNGSSNEEVRVEFHFPREIDGQPSIPPETEKVIFHCRATAKTERPGEQNAIAFRAEFHPNEMKAHGQPDL